MKIIVCKFKENGRMIAPKFNRLTAKEWWLKYVDNVCHQNAFKVA